MRLPGLYGAFGGIVTVIVGRYELGRYLCIPEPHFKTVGCFII